MSTPLFAYLATPDGGLATLEHEGQRFVPLFTRKEDLFAFGNRCRDQLEGYDIHLVTGPSNAARLMEVLIGAALHIGVAEQVVRPNAAETAFAIVAPDVLRRTFEQSAGETRRGDGSVSRETGLG